MSPSLRRAAVVVAGLAITLGSGSAAFASTQSHPGDSRPVTPIACWVTEPLPPGSPTLPTLPPGAEPAAPTGGGK